MALEYSEVSFDVHFFLSGIYITDEYVELNKHGESE